MFIIEMSDGSVGLIGDGENESHSHTHRRLYPENFARHAR